MAKKKGTDKLQLNPPIEVKEKIKTIAKSYGISVNAYMTPIIGAVARGEIIISAGKVEFKHESKADALSRLKKPDFPMFE